jgi:recombination protein RecT
MREPKIMNVDPRVVYREVSKIAALGLLLDPQLGECWLIVDRNNDIQARVGYRGLIKLARQSGDVSAIFSVDICENDFTKITQGTERSITHEPDYTKDRGKPAAYYAVVEFKDGTKDFEVMSLAEIHAIRDRSDAWKAFKRGLIKSTPWSTDEGEMSKKTVLRRLLKRCPMSPDLADLLDNEDRYDEADMRDVTPRKIASGSLSSRLSALASPEPEHDPDTGEIHTEQNRGPSPEAVKDAEGGSAPLDTPSASDPSDDFPGDAPGRVETARLAGEAHAKAGGARRAMPGEYRADDELAEAWLEGFDSKQKGGAA